MDRVFISVVVFPFASFLSSLQNPQNRIQSRAPALDFFLTHAAVGDGRLLIHV